MLLAVEPFSGFSGLLQILLIIVAACLSAAFVVTVFMHYRRKRKKEIEPEDLSHIVAASPESTTYKLENEYVLFDHSGLIKEYKAQLVNNHAKYNALRQDFEKLENKYNSLLLQTGESVNNIKTDHMQQLHVNGNLQENATIENDNDISVLKEKLEVLNHSYHDLKNANEELAQKLVVLSADDEDRAATVDRWQHENKLLKTRVAELECMKDLMDEKKSQIDFLQQQLEQRIRNYHRSEQQLAATEAELSQVRNELAVSQASLQSIRSDFEDKETRLSQFATLLEEKSGLLAEKEDRVVYLDNILREIKDQNELLNASVADLQEKNDNLGQLLDDERSRIVLVEQKLQANKQLMQRIYKEFASCMTEQDNPPVVSLRPAYINASMDSQWEETAAQ